MADPTMGQMIGAGIDLFGGFKKASGIKATGKAAREAGRRSLMRGYEQAGYYNVAAGQARAMGQIASFEDERQARLIASRAVAVAAAGGYSADIVNLLADIEGEGAYQASISLFEAETQAEQLRFAGTQAIRQGEDDYAYGKAQYKAAKKAARGAKIGSLSSVFKVF
jgi:hypothetical protein